MSVKTQCPLLAEACLKANKISAHYNKLNFHMLGHFIGSTFSAPPTFTPHECCSTYSS
jgi:hypothetical protein